MPEPKDKYSILTNPSEDQKKWLRFLVPGYAPTEAALDYGDAREAAKAEAIRKLSGGQEPVYKPAKEADLVEQIPESATVNGKAYVTESDHYPNLVNAVGPGGAWETPEKTSYDPPETQTGSVKIGPVKVPFNSPTRTPIIPRGSALRAPVEAVAGIMDHPDTNEPLTPEQIRVATAAKRALDKFKAGAETVAKAVPKAAVEASKKALTVDITEPAPADGGEADALQRQIDTLKHQEAQAQIDDLHRRLSQQN